ncbi:MAG: UDP-2,3-diacylglucosamine diphosphatase [Formosimonas sp.]
MNPAQAAFCHADLGGVCFISDLHLSAHLPQTMRQFETFCHNIAPQFDTLLILGDLFEFWVGDDTAAHNPTAQRVVELLQALTQRGVNIGFVAGNRDFLLGEDFAQRAGMTRLPDPCVLRIQGQAVVVSHGDALCVDDADYQRFRRVVHTAWVQRAFLKSPAPWRVALAHHLRQRSQRRWAKLSTVAQQQLSRQQDVSAAAVERLLSQHSAHWLIHGHTHRPSTHLTFDSTRLVLPDWDCDSTSQPRWGYVAWPLKQAKPAIVLNPQ